MRTFGPITTSVQVQLIIYMSDLLTAYDAIFAIKIVC